MQADQLSALRTLAPAHRTRLPGELNHFRGPLGSHPSVDGIAKSVGSVALSRAVLRPGAARRRTSGNNGLTALALECRNLSARLRWLALTISTSRFAASSTFAIQVGVVHALRRFAPIGALLLGIVERDWHLLPCRLRDRTDRSGRPRIDLDRPVFLGQLVKRVIRPRLPFADDVPVHGDERVVLQRRVASAELRTGHPVHVRDVTHMYTWVQVWQ